MTVVLKASQPWIKGVSFNAPPRRMFLIATHEYDTHVEHTGKLRSL